MKAYSFSFAALAILLLSLQSVNAFGVDQGRFFRLTSASHPTHTHTYRKSSLQNSSGTSTPSTSSPKINKAKPRTGIAQNLLNFALTTPFWKLVLVPQARSNIIKTAEANGIQWDRALSWIKSQEGPWQTNPSLPLEELMNANTSGITKIVIPEYYQKEFHAYDRGNLEWNAALEQEIASRAVGARNFPAYGSNGEDAFRRAFDNAIRNLGGKTSLPQGVLLDMGCGTGTSTRRLAAAFPDAKRIIGMDLSPYFIEVGKKLLQLAPITGQKDGGDWVNTITYDERIELLVRDVAKTNMDDESVDVVNLGLVIHELPIDATIDICQEALRILKPGGQLWISEMDYDSPAFAEQRNNALLFSLIRSTEPYLDVYADGVEEVREYLVENFESVKITAATGRHYALVATKGDNVGLSGAASVARTKSLEDSRFGSDGNYVVDDTHLKTWESKSE